MEFFQYLKKIEGIEEILCVDIDKETLDLNKEKIQPAYEDYLHARSNPLKVCIYEGSVIHNDDSLKNTDAVICIELYVYDF